MSRMWEWWHRVTLPFRARRALVRFTEVAYADRVRLERLLAERDWHIERLDLENAALREDAERADALRVDALRIAEQKTDEAVALYRRLAAIDELTDGMPPELAARVRVHTRLELQEAST